MGAVLGSLLYLSSHYGYLVGLLVPSLIHVYLFTLLFILSGALRTKETWPLLEAGAMILMPFIIFFWPIHSEAYSPGSYALTTFMQTNFQLLTVLVGNLFHLTDDLSPDEFLFTRAGLRIQIFISFAYCYHFLNWFSKVSLIGWLRGASRRQISLIAILWFGSIALYAYNYVIGLQALFLLSLLHVTLEFPLNVVSIKGIGEWVGSQFRR